MRAFAAAVRYSHDPRILCLVRIFPSAVVSGDEYWLISCYVQSMHTGAMQLMHSELELELSEHNVC